MGVSGFRSGLDLNGSAGCEAGYGSPCKGITCYTELRGSGLLHRQHQTAGVTPVTERLSCVGTGAVGGVGPAVGSLSRRT